ncbi:MULTISPECIES: alcohol dehydrogenase catalytic domain-containing protein [unclassified Streptomyces]|uniref:alcohol dehydrogenase catalytic domain-containing protein n=1 Tax=unclassified Streptomyces TaxID=2593676 RepID=UPI001487707C|nr:MULTISPECIES: alcohol dehydrogenase catalytic domain-containing protein [unclassified Streptomyces]
MTVSQDNRPAHRAAQVTESGGPLHITAVQPREPGPGEVRLDVKASGICGADAGMAANPKPAYGFPIAPGHEVAGVVAEVGEGVAGWTAGERAGVGWFGGSCGQCTACRSGDVVHCAERRIPGLSYAGGWATTITVPAAALIRIPDGLSFAEAAPFGCAGVTTFNALRHSGAEPGDRVAVLGIGGLGHFAVQFAAAMGFETVAIGRGEDKRATALGLGAHHYVDGSAEDAGKALRALGSAKLILSTAASSKPLAGLLDGLTPHGRLTVVGFDGAPLQLPLDKLVMHARHVTGHVTGSPVDTEQAMRFALTSGVRPQVQTAPLEQAAEALKTQQAGQARFRMVLTTSD